MFVDWRQPPKSLNDYWSGKYHQEWRPLINRRLAFNRKDWKRLIHSFDCGEFYQVEEKATVHLDTATNLNCSDRRLMETIVNIRLIEIPTAHRRQGLMTRILEDLLDQFHDSDLVAVVYPQDLKQPELGEVTKRIKQVYLDLGFIELDWCLFAKLEEWYGFEMRSEKRGFRPPIMVHVGSEYEEVWQEMMIR